MKLTLGDIADHVGGSLNSASARSIEVDGASIDSRSILPGQLFVPIVAERDGHEYIESARQRGANAWFVAVGKPASSDQRSIVVPDTTTALQQLSGLVRRRLPDRIAGVTGSVGKTSTKDLLGAVLRERAPAMVSAKSFNNELGVPLTLLNAPDDCWAGVVEMGARGPGHIRFLCEFARPTVGVITNIGSAHLELFGSREVIADSKSELIAGLPSHGVAVLNFDSDLYARMVDHASTTIVSFSATGNTAASVYATDVRLNSELRATFIVHTPDARFEVALGARGLHQVANALAASIAARAFGSTIEEIKAGLATSDLSPLRMDLVRLPSGTRVLNDTYNANPVSMRAALDSLAQMNASRRFAFLGPMAELGPDRNALHLEVAEHGRDLGLEGIVSVGEPAYGTTNVEDIDAAIALCAELALGPDDVVLVKGSRVAELERLVQKLLEGPR